MAMHILHIDSLKWHVPSMAQHEVPPEREGHTASVVGNSILVLGGTWMDEEDKQTLAHSMPWPEW